MKQFLILLFIFPYVGLGQFSDDFSDANFTSNPTWIGDTANFEVDGNFELHLNAPAVADESYLSTQSIAVDTASWEFTVRLDFNPSSGNRARVYLMSTNSDLEGSLNGYYVQIGNTEDEVSLYRQSGTTSTKIIDGVDDLVDTDPAEVMVLVNRSTNGHWELFADTSLTSSYVMMGDTIDSTYQSSAYFGVFCDYTSTRSDKFYFDNITVTGNAYLDTDAPEIVSSSVLSNNSIQLVFNESIDSTTASSVNNYSADNGLGSPTSAGIVGDSAVILTWSNTFTIGTQYALTIAGVEDEAGNEVSNLSEAFIYYEFGTPTYRDVVINEIMADPAPSLGLPEIEYVEILNTSSSYFNLEGATFSDATNTRTIQNQEIMGPGEYIILCDLVNIDSVSGYGRVIGLSSFPTLNNGSDDLSISIDGILCDFVSYSDTWYGDPDKQSGGYSLEQINPLSPCTGADNWSASDTSLGGTPSLVNSIYNNALDSTAPEIAYVNVLSLTSISIHFNETMDSASLANSSYSISGGIVGNSVVVDPISKSYVTIELSASLDSGSSYTLNISQDVADCSGNWIWFPQHDFAIGITPRPFDLVFNEFIADPDESLSLPQYEFVELYNRSGKILYLEALVLSDATSNAKLPARLLYPNEYLIVCDDDASFEFAQFGNVAAVSSMPTLNNSGDRLVLSRGSAEIDVLEYSSYWFNPSSPPATFERIDPNNLCGLVSNWALSTEVIGGSPGSLNSVIDTSQIVEPPTFATAQFHTISEVTIDFGRKMDPISLIEKSANTTGNELLYVSISDDFSKVTYQSQSAFERGKEYTITVSEVKDCVGQEAQQATAALYLHDLSDVVINEVLSNPRASGSDYVELYNQSDFDINLQYWSLGYLDTKDSLRFKVISESPIILQSGNYIALNEEKEDVLLNYPGADISNLFEMDLPSYSNDEGSVLLYDQIEEIMERFNYTEDLHFDLIDELDGVSLERLDANRHASDVGNWHSASSTENYGTPGYINSQDYSNGSTTAEFELSAKHISPDNDGYQDVVNINYSTKSPGSTASVTIFNDRGIPIRTLNTNYVLGSSGSITWDGTNDDGEKARTGIHVVLVETYDLKGGRERYRLPVVVATKL